MLGRDKKTLGQNIVSVASELAPVLFDIGARGGAKHDFDSISAASHCVLFRAVQR